MNGQSSAGAGASSADQIVRFEIVDHGRDALVVHVLGEIDTLTAPVLREKLDEHLPTTPLVVLDLSAVTFLGSAGLAVLVSARDTAEQHGHRLRLVCGSRIATRALEATGLLTLFDVADGVSEALGAPG
ncbi:STAS domain-containing protein [Pseudonocardia hispaniensis]|uniref:Anti-sigma factor antagonist n=1 Tax=Pseudonocardia hispaniensis TaxID=904933 RepID=A0ABW1J6J5_9PSEU